jgi:hypothetical protein
MKRRYTVVWSSTERRRLADLWIQNTKIRQDITDAADLIDATLAETPYSVGIKKTELARYFVCDPLAVLYVPYEEDREVHVIFVKFWED